MITVGDEGYGARCLAPKDGPMTYAPKRKVGIRAKYSVRIESQYQVNTDHHVLVLLT